MSKLKFNFDTILCRLLHSDMYCQALAIAKIHPSHMIFLSIENILVRPAFVVAKCSLVPHVPSNPALHVQAAC